MRSGPRLSGILSQDFEAGLTPGLFFGSFPPPIERTAAMFKPYPAEPKSTERAARFADIRDRAAKAAACTPPRDLLRTPGAGRAVL